VTSGHSRVVSQRAPPAQHPESPGTQEHVDFEHIYREHVAFVWRTLRATGVPESLLEDATHEVFVVLHQRLHDWDGRCRMTTWLFGIARGVSRNVLRGQRRADRKLTAVRLEPPKEPERFSAPDGGVSRVEAARVLERFLAQLEPRKRRAFELCEIEGLSAGEAAECLGENANTIATRLRRARLEFDAFLRELNARSS